MADTTVKKNLAVVGNRKAAGTIKGMEAYGFKKIGDAYAGTYRGTKTAIMDDKDKPNGKREGLIVILDPDEGDRFGVWANDVLRDLMESIEVGTFVKIEFTEQGEPKGKKAGVKKFSVTKYE